MANEADIADIFQENRMQQALLAARTAKPTLTANGHCHFCEEELPAGHLFCNTDCRVDWEREEAAAARSGTRRRQPALA